MGEEGVLHGPHGDQPAQEDEGGVEQPTAQGRRPALSQPDGEDDDADHGGGEAEQDADVAEGAVHRRPGRGVRPIVPGLTAWSRSAR